MSNKIKTALMASVLLGAVAAAPISAQAQGMSGMSGMGGMAGQRPAM